jgi:hypothetical protein
VTPAIVIPEPVILVGGVALVLACGAAAAAAILSTGSARILTAGKTFGVTQRERDIAAAIGWPWRRWMALRLGAASASILIGIESGVWLLMFALGVVGVAGVPFAIAGHAAKRRLRTDRAFLGQIRELRDRMAIGNQSLDTALTELGRNPEPLLERTLRPLADPGSITANIVECGVRSGSPIVENVCGVLIWARTRSLDALISIIDDVILPVGEAQLAVEEESLVTLTQQRAVTFAMAALMAGMMAAILRVDSFRTYYQSAAGSTVLLAVLAIFFTLVWSLGRIIHVSGWARWDLRSVAAEEARPRG